jgi:oxygen-independent coproporphyrinogen III oxidase
VRRGWVIRQLLCDLAVDKSTWRARYGSDFDASFGPERQALQPFLDAGLVRDDADAIAVTGQGWLVARNVAAAFDSYLGEGAARYSRTV